MGVFNRLKTVVKSNVNSAISKAEDPEKMLDQLLIDMNEQYVKSKKQVAVAIADEKKLKRRFEEQQQLVDDWTRKSEKAVMAGEDELALEALKRKAEHEGMAEGYEKEWLAQKESSDRLKNQLKDLSNKIEEAKRKKNLIVARSKRAKAEQTIQNTMSGLNDNAVFDTFDRMEEKVDNMECEVDAYSELDYEEESLESKIDALDTSDSVMNDELEELKRKLGK